MTSTHSKTLHWVGAWKYSTNPLCILPGGTKSQRIWKAEIKNLLLQKVIHSVQTEWTVPIVYDPKKDGSLRFYVNYRKMNAVTNVTQTRCLRWMCVLTPFGRQQCSPLRTPTVATCKWRLKRSTEIGWRSRPVIDCVASYKFQSVWGTLQGPFGAWWMSFCYQLNGIMPWYISTPLLFSRALQATTTNIWREYCHS